MHLDPTTIALQLVNFLALVWLLRRFLFRPVLAAIDRREADLRSRRQQADDLAADAAAIREALRAERQTMAQEEADLRAQAHAAAEAERRRMLDGARRSADALRAAAAERIAAERAQAEVEMQRRVGDLALDIAARLLADARPDLADRVLIGALCQELRSLPSVGGPVAVTTARPVPADLRAELDSALGVDAAPAWSVDPALIAGIELSTPQHLIQQSWRSALAAARDGLRHD